MANPNTGFYILLLHFSTILCIELPNVTISFPDIADCDYQNESLALMTNSNPIFELICNANYPVEWIFHYSIEDDGSSEYVKLASTYRHVSDFNDITSYNFTAKLRMEYKGKLLSLANFTCRPAEQDGDFNSDLQTHVTMREQNRLSLVILEITSDPPIVQHQDFNENNNCSRAAAVMGRQPGGLLPCNRCDFPETGKKLELDYLKCLTPTECESTYSRQNKGTECLQRVADKPPKCQQVRPHFNPTLLVCKNFGPALSLFYFFGVFRGNRGDRLPGPPIYYNWAEADPKEMLYMRPFPKKIVYTGEQVNFTCEYSRYYFSMGSWFGIKNNDGMVYIKAIDKKPCDTEIEKEWQIVIGCSLTESWRGTYTGFFNTSFHQVGPHEVFCLGPVWNSTEWVNTSTSFNVERSEHPQIVSVEPDESKQFEVGQVNRKLICKVAGKPVPQITWKGNNESFYTTKQVDEFTSEITFVEVGQTTGGKYTCSATSFLGSDEKTFQLISYSGNPLSGAAIAGISVSVIILVTIVSLAVMGMIRMRRVITAQRSALRLLTEAELNEFIEGNPQILEAYRNDFLNKANAIEALPYDQQYEIPLENLAIEFSKVLGSGEYGVVVKGTVHTANASHYVNLAYVNNTRANIEVAVKVSKGNLDVTCFKALLTEIKVMAYLGGHKNIASLVGASTKNIQNTNCFVWDMITGELYIAVEYCDNGSLDKFLALHKSEFVQPGEQGQFTVGTLFQWSMDIAEGLQYIHGKKIIHADLAIRNILLTKDLVAKVADFGLSRQLAESSSYTKTTRCALPWRNMAIESLKNLVFSAKSDMWSFGVTLWELFTLGDTPYPGMSYTLEFTNILERGLRLYKPPLASSALYDYMLMCWSNEPNDRPGTSDLKVICLNEIN